MLNIYCFCPYNLLSAVFFFFSLYLRRIITITNGKKLRLTYNKIHAKDFNGLPEKEN